MPLRHVPEPALVDLHPFARTFAQSCVVEPVGDELGAGVAVAVFDLAPWLPLPGDIDALIGAAAAQRAARQRIPANRDALRASYALQRLWIARVLGRAPAGVEILRDDKGRPHLADPRLHTSLSHADGRVALALTATGPVGIDLEPAARASAMHELEERVTHPGERAGLPAAPDARARALLELWVRKEALLKAAGIGLELEMDRFAAPEATPLPLPGTRFAGRWVEVRAVDAGEAWVMAVAAAPGAALRVGERPVTR